MSKSFVKKFLSYAGFTVNYSDDLELIFNDKVYNITVKTDNFSQYSNYIAIGEIKSKLYALVVMDDKHETLWLVKTRFLKKFIEENPGIEKDYNGGKIQLFKYDKLLPVFTRLDNLFKEDVFKKVKQLL